jgi:F0F1-type ATP synthase assembly protein I
VWALNRRDDGDGPSQGLSPFRYVGFGAELLVPLIVGVIGGRWLDRRFGTEPWLLLVLTVLGAVAGMVNLIRRAMPPGGPGAGKS